jgi:hypothetical protein
MLTPMIESPLPTHWLLAACPPSLTRHAGRWVSHGARRAWTLRWSADLFAQLAPLLREPAGSRVETMLVGRTVQGMAERLVRQHGPIRLLDARRPRLGHIDDPLRGADATPSRARRWTAPLTGPWPACAVCSCWPTDAGTPRAGAHCGRANVD